MSKKNILITALILTLVIFPIIYFNFPKIEPKTVQAEVLSLELQKIKLEKIEEKTKLEKEQVDLKTQSETLIKKAKDLEPKIKELEIQIQTNNFNPKIEEKVIEKTTEKTSLEIPKTEVKVEAKEGSKIEEKKELEIESKKLEETKPEITPPIFDQKSQEILNRFFPKQGKTGQQIYDSALANPNAFKLVKTFEKEFGLETSIKSAIVLCHENCSFDSQTVGVCNPKFQINGDYRRCVYADVNTDGGMDAGLKQINTFWQRYRIAKLGGPSCEPNNSRDITDPCTKSQVGWLLDIDNNIKIAIDIYRESKFKAWVGARNANIN